MLRHPILLLLILATPVVASNSSLPKLHATTKASRYIVDDDTSIYSRLLLLEEFEKQQRDYNSQVDKHLTQHVDEMLRTQGEQNEKIQRLQSKMDIVFTVGQIGGWLFGFIVTALLYLNSQKQAAAIKRRDAEDSRFSKLEESLKELSNQIAKLASAHKHSHVQVIEEGD